MSRSDHQSKNGSRTVNVRGRQRAFVDRKQVGRRDYYLLERVGSPLRERYLAFDPRNGAGGDYFLFQVWPNGPATEQYFRVLERLKDDCLPRACECQRCGENIHFVLTWVEGISLAEYFENIRDGRRPPVAPSDAIRLISGLANAICKISQKRQVAHGDIQPANVIITDHTSRLVLIDFGSAWTSDKTCVRESGDGLNRCYAPPELQTPGIPVHGFLADQFSVSVLLYELVTQQLPYGGIGGKAGRPEYLDRARGSLRPPSEISPSCRDLPRSLRDAVDRVALRGLALRPEDRYPDRHAWLNDLFAAYASFRLAPEPATADSFLTRVIRWFIRSSAGK
jgi:serine/threonine protein kinase